MAMTNYGSGVLPGFNNRLAGRYLHPYFMVRQFNSCYQGSNCKNLSRE